MNSNDDPICPTHSIPKKELAENENLIHIETNGGGHVEFLSKLKPRMVSL
jgi:predicted alpha/beta-fold hydrolase